MGNLFVYIIRDCYAVFFCVMIVTSFLAVGKNYSKRIYTLFSVLILLAGLDVICGSIERYIATWDHFSYLRVVMSWVGYLTTPAILLTITEIMIRKEKPAYKWGLALLEFINIFVTSLAFFTHLVFYYDENNGFHVGVLGFVPRLVLVCYLVALAVVSIHYLKKRRWECIITMLIAFFMSLNAANEYFVFWPVDFSSITLSTAILAYFMYFTSIRHNDEVVRMNDSFSKSEQKLTNDMLEQAMETLAYTIDAKDRYTRGHSFRVAKYSRQIARLDGMSDEKCREIYFAGLLHDIGKISISETIINKAGELTVDEYEQIKNHPVTGAKILEKLVSFPYLQDGAKYHHERYDGRGYPYGIKGEEIPEIARIIAVADAYDTMTSHRTYRESMDQAFVKQEIWKGMGTQFDPHFAKVMISLIDSDNNYDMREKPGDGDNILYADRDEVVTWPVPTPQKKSSGLSDSDVSKTYGEYVLNSVNWSEPSESVLITDREAAVDFVSRTVSDETYLWYTPSVIVYHSADGKLAGKDYEELAVFVTAGYSWQTKPALRAKSEFIKTDNFGNWNKWIAYNKAGLKYRICVKRNEDVVYINLYNELLNGECYVRLPEDYDKSVFLTIIGEYCKITDLEINI